MKQSFVKISKITEPPYSDIWVYPKGTKVADKITDKGVGNSWCRKYFISR